MVTVWALSEVTPRLLIPAPSEAKLTVAVPLTRRLVVVLNPTRMATLLLDCGVNPVIEPLLLIIPEVVVPKEALRFSENRLAGALLVIESGAVGAVSPT